MRGLHMYFGMFGIYFPVPNLIPLLLEPGPCILGQGLNPGPLQWKLGVLTTRAPQNSPSADCVQIPIHVVKCRESSEWKLARRALVLICLFPCVCM